MKTALVMSGGGSRGAWECGAWEALSEMGIRFDAAYGTSIGAVNAALVAQDDLEKAIRLWETVTAGVVFGGGVDEEFSVDHMLTRKRDIVPFLLENAKNFQRDITPLAELLRESVDEDRLRATGIDMGCVITRFPQMSGRQVRLADMEPGKLHDFVIASASCFPVFPRKEIDGEHYIDGGYVDNMPIGMAVSDGSDEIIGLDIHPEPVHPEYNAMPHLKLIYPAEDLGSFLDFDRTRLKINRKRGYFDAMKAYGRYDGFAYAFEHDGGEAWMPQAAAFVKSVAMFDVNFDVKRGDTVLFDTLRSGMHTAHMSMKDARLRAIEYGAKAMDFRVDMLYNADVLEKRILNYVQNHEAETDEDKLFRLKGRELLCALFTALRSDDSFASRNAKKLMDHPCEVLAAMELVCADRC